MKENGNKINAIVACGGHTKNPLLLQEHADILEMPLYLTTETENMLLGGAINAARAAGDFDSLEEAMAAMCEIKEKITPQPDRFPLLRKKYLVFLKMYEHLMELEEILR